MNDRAHRLLLAGIIATTSLVQIWLAHRYFGFLTGDDVEVLAEAFRVATGYAYRAWDIRSTFIPDFVVAPPIWVVSHLGVHDVRTLIELGTLPLIAASALTIWLVQRLARRWGAGETGALIAAALFAFHWIPLAFGSTVYPRTIATVCVVAGALLASRSATGAFVAGMLAGVAFADRFSEIVFLIPLLAIAFAGASTLERRSAGSRRVVGLLAGAAVSVAITCGLHDYFTWGTAFSSVRKFAQLTVVNPDFASRVKYQSPAWYLGMLPRWCALTVLPLIWTARREWRPLVFIAFPLIILSFIRHKEVRYVQAMIPFLSVAAAIGFERMKSRRVAVVLVATSLVWNVYGVKLLARKSMPAVMAAQMLSTDPAVHGVVMSQLWAYGDRLYFGERMGVMDVGTPPQNLAVVVGKTTDAVALYESDLDQPILDLLAARGLHRGPAFRDPPARAVVVFTRSVSGTSDRVHR